MSIKDLNLLKKFPNLYIKLSVPDDFSEQTSKEFIYELFAFLKKILVKINSYLVAIILWQK